MVLAVKAGTDPACVFEAIRGGLAGSCVLDAKMPQILKRRFAPGFRIELHVKDLLNAAHTAHQLGVPVPLSGQILEYLKALKARGKDGDDHGGLMQFFEELAGVEVRGQRTAEGIP
jgi:2-hydroxy-3-oxopropionate reductase